MTTAETIKLIPSSSIWIKYVEKEKQALKRVLRNNLIQVHHIGSTAIHSISSRPILDLLVEVHTLDGVELFKNEFSKQGYTWLETNENKLYLERMAPKGSSTLSQIHIFDKNSNFINDYLDFRDYLNAEPLIAQEYNILKEEHNSEPIKYQKAKTDFIETVLRNIT